MNTTIYLIRHSIPFKEQRGIEYIKESLLLTNEKSPLSILEEENAKLYFTKKEFKNIDVVWSSNYVRAMSTAKYLANYNNLKVNIAVNFNERIHGIDNWSELPLDFEKKQFLDEFYKIGYGESINEVGKRMLEGINQILDNYKGKRIAIITHETAIMSLLRYWCDIEYEKE